MLSSILRLISCYLKIIYLLHSRYHPKTIGHVLKNKQKHKFVCYTINHNENEDKNEKRLHRYDITRPKTTHGHKCENINSVSVIWCLYVLGKHLSNIWSSVNKNIKQHWGWVEESVACKKSVYFYSFTEIKCCCFCFMKERIQHFD